MGDSLNDLLDVASTPACARLTLSVSECAYPGSLYPRLRGADLEIVALPALVMPLPPHAQGRRGPGIGELDEVASTPTNAGLTRTARCTASTSRLYPACTGLTSTPSRAAMPRPLYPRIHGADSPGDLVSHVVGASTPACAGLTASTRGP